MRVRGWDYTALVVSRLEQLDANVDALEGGALNGEALEALGRMYRIAKVNERPFWGNMAYGYERRSCCSERGA